MRGIVCEDRNSCVARAPLTLLYSIILKSETRVCAHELGAVHYSNDVIGRLRVMAPREGKSASLPL